MYINVKGKVIPSQARCDPEGRGIALLFHDRGTRRGRVVSSTPRPHFTLRKDPLPILQEAGWAPGPIWTAGKSRPHRDSIPDRPVRSQSLYRLSYPAHIRNLLQFENVKEKELEERQKQNDIAMYLKQIRSDKSKGRIHGNEPYGAVKGTIS